MRPRLSSPAMTVIGIAALAVVPWICPNLYYLHLLNLVSIYVIVVMGLNILTGYCGQISMGHAAFFAIGAYATAITGTRLGFPFVATFALSGLVGAVAGYLIGKPTLRLKGAYLSMATMGVGEILQMILRNWTSLTGGGLGIKRIPSPELFGFTFNTGVRFYYLAIAIVLVITLVTARISRSSLGRALIAIKDNETAAAAMGIDVARLKIVAFVLSTTYAGLAGSLFAHLNRYVSPDGFTFRDSVAFLCMVAAGGLGHAWGPLVGGSLLVFSKELFRALKSYQMVVYGLILVGIILFMPKGVAGTVSGLLARRGRVFRRVRPGPEHGARRTGDIDA